MMTFTAIEDYDNNNYSSQSTIIMDVDPIIESSSIIQSPPTNQRIKVLDNFLKSPTTVLDLVGSARSDDDEDRNSDSYDVIDISENTNSEDDDDDSQQHQRLQEMMASADLNLGSLHAELVSMRCWTVLCFIFC